MTKIHSISYQYVLIVTFLLISSIGANVVRADENTTLIKVTVLGSGTPVPSSTQFGAAMLVQAGGKNMMFDCGRGCTTRLAQLNKRLITKVDHLFITHLHSDHLMGIDDLWLNGWVQGRKVPLKTWGPTGTNDMMEGIRTSFKRDIAYRTNDKVPAPSAGLDNAFTDLPLKGGLILDEDGVKVSAFLVDHASIIPAYGYRIEYEGRSVVISGDTTTTESLYEQGKGVDVLMLEVLSPSTIDYLHSIFNEKQTAKVISYHMTAEQTADIFAATKPRLGVYYHTDNSDKSAKSLLSATEKVYEGPVIVSHDLFQILIGEKIMTKDVGL
jgi:ribonuclease Z